MPQSASPTRASSHQRAVDSALIATRTMTVAKVSKVLANGWVELEPQIQQVRRNPRTGEDTPEDLGLLCRVPIGFYKAGGFIFTLPAAIGDEGVVLFSDRSLDFWKETGRKGPPVDTRFHDLSDGVFVPWPTSQPGAIQGFNLSGAYVGLEDQTSYLHISNAGVTTLKSSVKVIIDTPATEITGTLQVALATHLLNTLTVDQIATVLNLLTPAGFNAQTHRHPNGGLPSNPSGSYVP